MRLRQGAITMSHPTTSRRDFLGYLATGLAATAAGPTILRASDKAGTKRPIVGSGEWNYEVYHDWGELPTGLKYGNTHGVCEDSHGNIYVHHTVHATSERHDTMVVFDRKGRFVRSWGREFEGGAHGLHIRREGRDEVLYLCDTKRALVTKVTPRGELLWQIGYPKESEAYPVNADGSPGIKYSPTNVAIAPDGTIYVGDGYGSSFINQYDHNGKFVRTFGGKGKEAGQLDCPHGLMVDTRGSTPVLMVADRSNKRIQTFSLAGQHLGFLEDFPAPCHFHERHGTIVVPDLFARVTLIDRDNRVITQLGEAGVDSWKEIRSGPRENFPVGKFVCPHSACFDHEGNIFVVEWVEVGRVTKLRKV
jgi:hypothetical protein